MKAKLLLKIAAAVGAFVLVGGISVAALARSGAGSSTPPTLPVVSTPEVENDDTETPEPRETEAPEADDQGEDADDQGEDADDQGEDADDQGEDADDQGEDEDSDDEDENEDSQDSDDDSNDDSEDSDDSGEDD